VNRLAGWAAAIALLGASAVLVAVTPTDISTPFELTGRAGDRIPTRLAEIEVVDVHLAERLNITYDDVDGSTHGVWLVVDARVTPTQDPIYLSDSTVRIHGVTYAVNDSILGTDSMIGQRFGAGITREGPFVFELPRQAIEGASTATVVITPSSDARLDTVAAVVVDLEGLDVLRSIDIGVPFVTEGRQ
jgi:hypothetical protein